MGCKLESKLVETCKTCTISLVTSLVHYNNTVCRLSAHTAQPAAAPAAAGSARARPCAQRNRPKTICDGHKVTHLHPSHRRISPAVRCALSSLASRPAPSPSAAAAQRAIRRCQLFLRWCSTESTGYQSSRQIISLRRDASIRKFASWEKGVQTWGSSLIKFASCKLVVAKLPTLTRLRSQCNTQHFCSQCL